MQNRCFAELSKKVVSIGCVLTLSVLLFLVPFLIAHKFGDEELASAAQFGDASGFLNAMVSGLAFLAIAWTLRLQMEELKEGRNLAIEARKEHEATLRVLKETAEANLLSAYLFGSDSYRRIVESRAEKGFPERELENDVVAAIFKCRFEGIMKRSEARLGSVVDKANEAQLDHLKELFFIAMSLHQLNSDYRTVPLPTSALAEIRELATQLNTNLELLQPHQIRLFDGTRQMLANLLRETENQERQRTYLKSTAEYMISALRGYAKKF